MNAQTEIKSPLPVNLEVEQALLGAILINGDAYWRVSAFLRPQHFIEPIHRRIFEVAGEMMRTDKRPSPINIKSFLPAELAIGDIDLTHYLARLAASATTVINAEDYGRTLFDLALRRSLIGLGEEISDTARISAPGTPAKAHIEDAELRLIELGEEAAAALAGRSERGASFDAVVDDAEARMVSGNHYRGARCGFSDLDDKLGGFAPGDFVILGGRPSMGKTALAIAMLRKASLLGVGAAFDTIEMREAALKQRLLSDECEAAAGLKIPYSRIARGRLSGSEVAALKRAAAKLRELPLAVIDRGDRLADLPGHIRMARRLLAQKNAELALFFIDYLGLLRPSDRYAGQRTNEVSEIGATVKALAKREGIAIVGLHQLNRANVSRDDRRPRVDDLRDSGSLEQDADAVLFVHREAYYIERPGYRTFKEEKDKLEALGECDHDLEVIVAKQRQGPIGTVKLWFDSATNAVRDAVRT